MEAADDQRSATEQQGEQRAPAAPPDAASKPEDRGGRAAAPLAPPEDADREPRPGGTDEGEPGGPADARGPAGGGDDGDGEPPPRAGPPPPEEEADAEEQFVDAAAEWAREYVGSTRSAGRDYYERVVFNVDVHGRSDPVEVVGYRLSPDTCSRLRSVYVRPDDYVRALDELHQRHLLILHGPAHVGKGTAATYLALCLADQAGLTEPARRLVRLAPTTPLAALRQFEFDAGSGYVVDTLARRRARELDPFDLDLVQKRLADRDAYLVVSLDSGSRSRRASLEGHQFEWDEPPDYGLVLRRHALGRPTDPAHRELVRTWLTDPRLVAVLPQLRAPRDAAELAAELVAAAADDSLAEDAKLDRALERHGAQALAKAAARFDAVDPRRQALMLVLASLDGVPYSLVLEAGERLWRRFPHGGEHEAGDEDDEAPRRPDPWHLRRSDLLREFEAETFAAYELHPHGWANTTCVRLRGPGTAEAILRHAWLEHGALRRPVLGWLEELVMDGRNALLVAAAQTLGLLATVDFAYLLDTVFEPWARDDPRRRTAVAIALGVAAGDDEHQQHVIALLDHWAAAREVKEVWTAATACGSVFGLTNTQDALDALRRIARSGSLALRHVVPRSLSNLFEAGADDPDIHLDVLHALVAWTDDQPGRATAADRRVAAAGRRAFLQLARPRSHPGDAACWRAAGPACLRPLATLWCRLLDAAELRRDAIVALGQAFDAADEDQDLAAKLAALVGQVAVQARRDELTRLRYQLGKWAGRRRRPCVTARRCLALIPLS